MLTQEQMILIINEKKYTKREIKLGSFNKQKYRLFFENTEYDQYNVYLDIWNSQSIEIKQTIQKRAKKSIPIIRIDLNAYHKNPSEIVYIPEILNENIINLMKKYKGYEFRKQHHIHYYIEGYDDKWAFPLDEFNIKIYEDLSKNLEEFCNNFNIETKILKEGLF